jgi:acetyltransferase-like isoleucine patch superfamily enzyme
MTERSAYRLPPGSLAGFARENGLYLTLHKIVGAIVRRSRDHLLARRLRTSGLRIGRHPRLSGLAHIRMGEDFSAGDAFWLDAITSFAGETFIPTLSIGANCNLSDSVHIACTNAVSIGAGLLCGSRVIISDHAHGLYSGSAQSSPDERPVLRPLSNNGTVTIGRNVWIGDGCAILAGANIGDGAVIGANSVVNGPIPSNTIAAGAPARVVRAWHADSSQWVSIPRDSPPAQ